MRLQGIEFDEEMVKGFKEVVPRSPAAVLIERFIQRIENEALVTLRDRDAKEEALRYAQGMLGAMGMFGDLGRMFAELDLEGFGAEIEVGMGDDDLMEADDVRY